MSKYIAETFRDPDSFQTVLRVGKRQENGPARVLAQFIGAEEDLQDLIKQIYNCHNFNKKLVQI